MTLTPGQIKDKLTNALDDDKNVIDEKEIEEVITLLEASTLTKEILEQTRLGRDINHVRKTVQNPSIRKRARNLVKAWQVLLVQQGSPQVANGQHPRISPGLSPALSKSGTPNKFVPSPALVHSRQQGLKVTNVKSPAAQISSRQPLPSSKLASQEQRCRSGLKVKSPAIGNNHTPGAHSININEGSNLSWPRTPPSNVSENSQDRLANDVQEPPTSSKAKSGQAGASKRNFNFDQKQTNHSISESSKSGNRVSDQKDLSKTNVANRKRTRQSISKEESINSLSELPDSKHPRLIQNPSLSTPVTSKNDVINGSFVRKNSLKPNSFSFDGPNSEKIVPVVSKICNQDQIDASSQLSNQRITPLRQESYDSRVSNFSTDSRKLGRVKTTEQIIEDMQRKSATPVGNNVIAQIKTNQIKKESDAQKEVLPTGVKKRGRKKKSQNLDLLNAESVSGHRLAQTKNEYIERFLQTSVAPTPGEDVYEPPIPTPRQESLEEQPIALGACSSNFSQSSYDNGFSSYSGRQDKPDSGPSASPPEAREISDTSGHLPSSYAPPDVNAPPSERLSEAQVLAQLPPIDYDNIDWSSWDYPAPQPAPVTDELVNQLHSENVESVNGTYDRDGQFKSWAEMLTTDSVYDEPLFILPYVMPN